MKPLTFLSFFAGIGGFDLGFQEAGMKCLGHIEIDPTCQRVLERHWPGKLKGTDVTKYLNAPPRNTRPDVICGGFPCQDLSVAGKRKGLAGERSGLWFAFRDIIAELKPRWVVIENVPGLLSSHEGRDFALLLYGLAELDYRLSSRVLDSQYLGVPQRRRRVFIVGCLGDGSCVEVLFEPESLCGDSPPSRAPGKTIAPTVEVRAGRSGETNFATSGGLAVAGTLGSSKGGFKTPDLDGTGAFIPDVCQTLTAEADASPDAEGRGFPIITGTLTNNGKAAGSATQQDAEGNLLVAPTVSSKWAKGSGGPSGDEVQNEVLDFVSAPLTTRPYGDNDGQEDKLVPARKEVWNQTCGCGHSFQGALDEPCPSCGEIRDGCTHGDPIAFSCKDNGRDASDVAPTLRAMPHDKSHQNGGGQVAIAYRVHGENSVAMQGDGNAEVVAEVDKTRCLDTNGGFTHNQGGNVVLVFDTTQVTSKTNRSKPKKGDPCHPLAAGAHAPAVAISLDMRNLQRLKDRDEVNRQSLGVGKEGDAAHTVTGKFGAVAFQECQSGCREYEDAGTLRSQGPGHDPVGTRLRTTMGVRRLTPRECERLQGFPDDWTRWDAEGKEISDSARYRMIGNAVTATVAKWIGKQLVAVHARKGQVPA